MSHRIRAAVAGVTIAMATSSLVGQTSVGLTASPARAAEFLQRLKEAVDSADRRAVSTLVAYPLTVLASGFNIPVKDPASFIRMYDAFVTPELRCAVVESAIPVGGAPAPRRPAIMTPDGLSMVEGAVWAPFKDGRYRIARIRVLPKASLDAFLVAIKKGETVTARIEGFRGHDGTIRASASHHAAKPTTLRPVPDAGRAASATAAGDGEYLIEVAHIAHYCDPPQRYKLTVTVR